MKKYIKSFFLAVSVLLLAASCQREIISGLDGSVDDRINTLIDTYKTDLKQAPNGWMVSVETSKGYYRFWMEFGENDMVTMYTDNTKYKDYKLKANKSTYVIRHIQRPTLIFDLYSYIAIINDPDKDVSGAGSYNEGLKTDFEFEVVNHEEGRFEMQGRFNKAIAIFERASAEDKAGVLAGAMMDRLTEVTEDLVGKYMYARQGTIEMVIKIYDERSLYKFWYDDNRKTGEDGMEYYNVEVDGSGDIWFPVPLEFGEVTLTGIKYEKGANPGDKGVYKEFYSKEHGNIPVTISVSAPGFPLERVFTPMDNKKIFNAATFATDLYVAMDDGPTKNALSLIDRMSGWKGFNLITSCDVFYYFSKDDTGKKFFNLYTTPQGIGIQLGGEAGLTLIQSFATATYAFPIIHNDGDMFFEVENRDPNTHGAAKEYFGDGITTPLVNQFKGKIFDVEWSPVVLNHGLLVQFRARDDVDNFCPPAILYFRTPPSDD